MKLRLLVVYLSFFTMVISGMQRAAPEVATELLLNHLEYNFLTAPTSDTKVWALTAYMRELQKQVAGLLQETCVLKENKSLRKKVALAYLHVARLIYYKAAGSTEVLAAIEQLQRDMRELQKKYHS